MVLDLGACFFQEEESMTIVSLFVEGSSKIPNVSTVFSFCTAKILVSLA